MDSVWYGQVNMPAFPSLEGNTKADVLIIGGGIAGILCAYMLKHAGVNAVLVEQGRLCDGVTGKTTAKITSQHGLVYNKLLRRLGKEKATLYLQSQQEALSQYRKLAKDIDCDYQEQDAFVYSVNNLKLLEQELSALDSLGFSAELTEDIPLPFSTVGAIKFPGQAQYHPLKFLSALAKDLPIYENTKVLELMPGMARTNHGTIRAEAMIIATHFPMLNKHGSFFLKLYQHRSYVLGLKNTPPLNGMYIGAEYPNLSFRNHGDTLLLGGCGHRTGKDGGGWQDLTYYAHRYYPGAVCEYRWATQDCMTLDAMPYIGRYSRNTPNLYVATGFGKWGMTSAMTAAGILRDCITGRQNPYEELFSPSRSVLHPQLAVNGFESVTNLLSLRKPRCPHMGCALKWNSQEHSWDCACHGSRFSETGEVLNNPATDDLKSKKRSR